MTSKIREAAVSIGLSLALGFALPAIALANETGNIDSSTSAIEEQETSVDEQSKEDPIASISEDNVPEAQTETNALIEQAPQDDNGTGEAVDNGELSVKSEDAPSLNEDPKDSVPGSEILAGTDLQLQDSDLSEDTDTDAEPEDEGLEPHWETTADGKKYYYNESGVPVLWSQTIDGKRYYFNGAGVMQTGWITFKSDNTRSYFDPTTGAAVTGWQDIAKKTYYFNPTTLRAVRWSQKLTGRDGSQHDYYFNGLGEMFTGLLTWSKDGTRSYFDPAAGTARGAALAKWQDIANKTYYFSPSTLRAVRWSQNLTGRDGTQRNYYFNGAGAMQTGFVTFGDGTKSYFDPEAGKTYGAAVTGWKTISGKTYYFQPTNLRAVRWTQNNLTGKDGKKHDYYFNSAGVMAIGAVNFGNTASLYNADGAKVVAQGWYTINSDKYYVRNQSPVRYNQTIDGKKYYFYGTYKLHRGWIYFSSTKTWAYYDDTTGAESTPQPGWSISGGKYYFYTPDKKLTTWNKNTYTNWVNSKNKTSGTKYLLTVNLDTCYMNVFEKSGSLWVPIKGWMVSVGNDEAGCPTPKGEHVIGSGMSSFKTEYWPADGDNCAWYATIFYHEPGRWTAFHSVIYKDYSKTKIKDPRLGYHITGSCVRMATENAIWIYNNIGRNTKAYIY
jgi:glucan-binding YG repeat protein